MSILNEGQNLYIRQGDTGNITFSGIPTDKTYSVYLSIYDEENQKILNEIMTTAKAGTAIFTINEDFSNNLEVGDWVYGLKICANGSEDTILPRSYIDDSGTLINESAPLFTVDYKYVKGDNN